MNCLHQNKVQVIANKSPVSAIYVRAVLMSAQLLM